MKNSYVFSIIDAKCLFLSSRHLEIILSSNSSELFCISMFPYPSGRLHMGHFRNYLINDIVCRYTSLFCGRKCVMYFGWDAFGLPAENASQLYGFSPFEWTKANIETMRSQLLAFNFLIDWRFEINTASYRFYRWSQFFFTLLYRKGYIYRKKCIVNWDPIDKTVLANEQVINGCGWRSGVKIERRLLDSYCVRVRSVIKGVLLRTRCLQWPVSVLASQVKWIGGCKFYTCRFVCGLVNYNVCFLNPFDLFFDFVVYTSYDYYLSVFGELSSCCSYDNGSDFVTAKLFICPFLGGVGSLLHLTASLEFEGFFLKRTASNFAWFWFYNSYGLGLYLKTILVGSAKVFRIYKYRVRDWCISRQRYWGTPLPIYYCYYCFRTALTFRSVRLPIYAGVVSYCSFVADSTFSLVRCVSCNLLAFRSVETLDTFFDSSWYFLNYLVKSAAFSTVSRCIDIYIGGREHSVLHLLYVRVFFAILTKIGYCSLLEPITVLITQGLILTAQACVGGVVYVKMSKSTTMVVDPVALIQLYGTDVLRLYTVFSTAITRDLIWDISKVAGCLRFIRRVWDFFFTSVFCIRYTSFFYLSPPFEVEFQKIVRYYQLNKFNLVVSTAMKFFNILSRSHTSRVISTYCLFTYYYKLVFYLHPICPGFTAIIWFISGNNRLFGDLYSYCFPVANVTGAVFLALQINGVTLEVFCKVKPIIYYQVFYIYKYRLYLFTFTVIYKRCRVLNFVF